MTADAFLAWAEGREGRFEFARGRIMMMVGASRNHANLAFRLGMMLAARLDPARWSVSSDGLSLADLHESVG